MPGGVFARGADVDDGQFGEPAAGLADVEGGDGDGGDGEAGDAGEAGEFMRSVILALRGCPAGRSTIPLGVWLKECSWNWNSRVPS